MALSQKDFLSIADYTKAELLEVLALAAEQCCQFSSGPKRQSFAGRSLEAASSRHLGRRAVQSRTSGWYSSEMARADA